MAVDLAKLSLWLATLAKDHPFTFLDHALRHGDSLVGLTAKQIAGFHWAPKTRSGSRLPHSRSIDERSKRVTDVPRSEILGGARRRALRAPRAAASTGRRAALDWSASSATSSSPPSSAPTKTRHARRPAATNWHCDGRVPGRRMARWKTASRWPQAGSSLADTATGPLPPFHWEIEFPEVFARENPGFDAFVGNPPFHGQEHADQRQPRSGYRRLAQDASTRSRTATPTSSPTSSAARSTCFAQSGLLRPDRHEHDRPGRHARHRLALDLHPRRHDLSRPQATQVARAGRRRRQRRPRMPKGALAGTVRPRRPTMCRRSPPTSSTPAATTIPRRSRRTPARAFRAASYWAWASRSTTPTRRASPLRSAEMHRLIAKDPRNAERIFPYIGGEEVNDSPTHAHHRYVINFGEMTRG